MLRGQGGYEETDWQTAFAACQLKRPCVRLNAKMRRVLEAWEREYPTRSKSP